MKSIHFLLIFCLFSLFLTNQSVQAQLARSPEEFFGFVPGSDGNLFDYDQLIAYFKQLDQASNNLT